MKQLSTKNSLILCFIFFLSCGKNIHVENLLETQRNVTQSEFNSVEYSGFLIKNQKEIRFSRQGKYFKISKYSSKVALDFISELPQGESPVNLQGEIQGEEIVITRFL